MLLFGCGSCQMTQMSWAFPAFPNLIFCLIPACLAYYVLLQIEGAPMGRKIEFLLICPVAFVVGIGFMPILVFPLMLLILPLLLLIKLASKKKSAKIVALLGLLPFLFVLGKAKWDERNAGPYYKLDSVKLPSHYAHRLGKNPLPSLSQAQLVQALGEGPDLRRHNASIVLQSQIYKGANVQELESLLKAVRDTVGSSNDRAVIELTQHLESAIAKHQEDAAERQQKLSKPKPTTDASPDSSTAKKQESQQQP